MEVKKMVTLKGKYNQELHEILVDHDKPGLIAKPGDVLENLYINGGESGGNIGIKIENGSSYDKKPVYIKNVTIVNCEIGIEITAGEETDSKTGDLNYVEGFSECTNITNTLIYKAKRGIVFRGQDGSNSFAYTYINGVGIVTLNDVDSVGIEVQENATLYGSYINQVTVELNSFNSIGLKMGNNSSILGAFLDLAIWFGRRSYPTYSKYTDGDGKRGIGVFLSNGADVDKNMHSCVYFNHVLRPFASYAMGDIHPEYQEGY
jgi:hypothetical protein